MVNNSLKYIYKPNPMLIHAKHFLVLLRCCLIYLIFPLFLNGQSYQLLDNLSLFNHPSSNWQDAGGGVLVCELKNGAFKPGDNLITMMEHGDLDLSLDVMIPKGSNSGIYLQGRYEVQVFDSWGKMSPSFDDAGGIYQRWDENRGKNNEGYEGHAPRFNAVKAPGLWNHVEISFQAPRFDNQGKKISNASLLKVTWNGMVIHQQVELFGPTRAAAFPDEKPMGPLMFQGDHGPVTYRNIRITKKGNASVKIVPPVQYKIYENAFTREKKGDIQSVPKEKDLSTLTPVKIGETELIDVSVSRRGTQYYVITGSFEVSKTNVYLFKGNYHGYANVLIDNELVLSDAEVPWYGMSFNEEILGKKSLTAGKHTFRIGYTHRDWERQVRAFGLSVKAEGEAEGWQPLHDKKSELEFSKTVMNEVYLTNQPVFQRSFVVFDGAKRTHAFNVGFPQGVHYSYDTKTGALLNVWRGRFINTTEMWHDRGNEQIAEPLGVSQQMTGLFPLLDKSNLKMEPQTSLRYEGMALIDINGQKTPQFVLKQDNIVIKDWLQPMPNQQGITRQLAFSSLPADKKCLLAMAKKGIKKIADGLYAIDDFAYFIKIDAQNSPVILEKEGQQWLISDIKSTSFTYQIVF
jgi:hypothetical protein